MNVRQLGIGRGPHSARPSPIPSSVVGCTATVTALALGRVVDLRETFHHGPAVPRNCCFQRIRTVEKPAVPCRVPDFCRSSIVDSRVATAHHMRVARGTESHYTVRGKTSRAKRDRNLAGCGVRRRAQVAWHPFPSIGQFEQAVPTIKLPAPTTSTNREAYSTVDRCLVRRHVSRKEPLRRLVTLQSAVRFVPLRTNLDRLQPSLVLLWQRNRRRCSARMIPSLVAGETR